MVDPHLRRIHLRPYFSSNFQFLIKTGAKTAPLCGDL